MSTLQASLLVIVIAGLLTGLFWRFGLVLLVCTVYVVLALLFPWLQAFPASVVDQFDPSTLEWIKSHGGRNTLEAIRILVAIALLCFGALVGAFLRVAIKG